ncbi:MAG: cytidylate kinase-like family protein [Lachnospiraceae bacterium]|nr:cytidylate kinase-like family protein [Lachnospiraceae bacterium]
MDKVIITIARSYGSGGRTMGKLLAQDLGIKYYDREILRLASDESGIDEALFGKADEKLKNTSLFKIARKAYQGELIPPESDDFTCNDNLFNYQAKVIKELAEEESCVIIGRCADYILKDHPNVIRLYCYAPLLDCIKREQAQSSLSEVDIIRKINRIDKYRSDYYKYYTGADWRDVRNYDFCLNTASMSYEQLIEAVKAYIHIYKK